MFETIEKLDQEVLLLVNSANSPFLDEVMWQVSHQLIWIPLFIFIIFYAYKKLKLKSVLFFMIGVAFCFLLADRISVMAFKEVFLRYRPTHNSNIQHQIHTYLKSNGDYYLGGQYGFVSSHATNFFALTTYLIFNFKQFSKKWYFLFLWASLIGYSRVYLGVHYPLDVICGALLGMSIGWIVYKTLIKLSLLNYTK